MKAIITGRGLGKTTAVVKWVKEGTATASYPFWSRVILTADIQRAQYLRKEFGLSYTQVFGIVEWKNAHIGRLPVEVAIDDLEAAIYPLLGYHNELAMITMTGECQHTEEVSA